MEKLGWKLLTRPDIWDHMFSSKYLKNGNLFETKKNKNSLSKGNQITENYRIREFIGLLERARL